jgi:hypothetical protein
LADNHNGSWHLVDGGVQVLVLVKEYVALHGLEERWSPDTDREKRVRLSMNTMEASKGGDCRGGFLGLS